MSAAGAEGPGAESRRILDPVERLSEVLFGLIMVLSFTGSLSAATAGREEVRTMLFGAIGCNLAWGIVDGVMYVMNNLLQRGRSLSLLRALRKNVDPAVGPRIIAETFPPMLAALIRPAELQYLHGELVKMGEPPRRPRLTLDDLRGGVAVFIFVFLSTFPVVIPFAVFQEPVRALRISNAIALALLFLAGYTLGKYAGFKPIRTGLAMAAIGTVLVSLTIALGG